MLIIFIGGRGGLITRGGRAFSWMCFFCLKLDALITGGLICEGGEVGFLVLQPFMVVCFSRGYKENRTRKKPAFYALLFQYLNPSRL